MEQVRRPDEAGRVPYRIAFALAEVQDFARHTVSPGRSRCTRFSDRAAPALYYCPVPDFTFVYSDIAALLVDIYEPFPYNKKSECRDRC